MKEILVMILLGLLMVYIDSPVTEEKKRQAYKEWDKWQRKRYE